MLRRQTECSTAITVEEFNSDAARTVGAFLEPMHSMTYLLINYMQRRRTIAM